ncbi:elongation factor P hydroxylase [Idiomarina sp.]|uniref:elongation factor P hydroxylase n=1 Tax=Idiomarina sp. TaxID=1874361 RepID=UPI0025C43999|nr:elongation factor P hydroxylase [Idiomarina sp.]MEC7644251.1 elongation factor P hydroxylase [Pseudomonadota bacterium]NQZ03816.1 elongation factor P hydroxylase [Idiomarina sp.]
MQVSSAPHCKQHARHYQQLIDIFNQCFAATERTILVCGDDEPYYRPAAEGETHHQVVFAHGFFASALHEVAHWCIAGRVRRHIFDYGYWYVPDGRDAMQQQQFEKVEVKPQALEKLFSECAGVPFQVSVDNLSGIEVDRAAFDSKVSDQLFDFLRTSLPTRAKVFAQALCRYYQRPWPSVESLAN